MDKLPKQSDLQTWIETIQDVYRVELKREVDPSGLSSCILQIAYHNWNKDSLVNWIRQSDEYKNLGSEDNHNPPSNPVPNPDLPEPSVNQTLQSLGVRGTQFITTDNNFFRPQEGSAFPLFYEFINGFDAHQFVELQRRLKRNCLRVAGMLAWPDYSSFRPQTYGDGYYVALDLFFEYYRSQGFYVEFMALCDAQIIFKDNIPALKNHFKQVADIVSKHSDYVLLEIANEPYQNLPDGLKPQDLYSLIPSNVLYNAGAGPDSIPYIPPGKYASDHSPRDDEWERKGKGGFDLQYNPNEPAGIVAIKVPVIENESIGASENLVPGKRDNRPERFFDYAADTSLFGGACAHSDSGLTCTTPKPLELECLEAFAKGQEVIPVECLGWTYYKAIGPNPLSNPDDQQIRLHGVLSPDRTKAIVVAVRPATSDWTPIAHPDWKVVRTEGLTPQRQNVVFLERR